MAESGKNQSGDSQTDAGLPQDELELLLESYCIGTLDEAGWQRVNTLIAGDESAARRYAQAAHFCQTLRDETSVPGPGRSLFTDPEDLTTTKKAETKPNRGRGLPPWVSQMGLAAGMAFVCGWMVAAGYIRPNPTAQNMPTTRTNAPPMRVEEPSPDGSASIASIDTGTQSDRRDPLGRVTGLTTVASSDGLLRPLRVGSQLRRGEVFQLTQGAARLEIGGNEVLVEGPAELSAIGPQSLFVRQGRVTIPQACSISVQTPLTTIGYANHQKGTYVVVVNHDASTTLCCLEGELTVHSASGRRHTSVQPDRIEAGQSLRFSRNADQDQLAVTSVAQPKELLLAWDETAERLHPYERLVLSDTPIAYWPLYRVRRHRSILDLTQNGYDGQAIGNWPTQLSDVHGSQLRGAYFDGESYIETDRKPPVDLHSGFTVESWAKVAGGPEYQSVFTSRWVLDSNTDRQQCLGFTLYAGADDKWQFWTGSGQYGENWQELRGPVNVDRSRWNHVVASFAPHAEQNASARSVAGTVRLYVDGIKVAQSEHRIGLGDFEWPARIGAAEFVPKSLTSWLFRGELRDVALYDHVLNKSRIKLHAERGRKAT